jgi:type IV pilus assembly protein PilQ
MAAAEARAQEAIARAKAAEAQLKASKGLSEQRRVEAELLGRKAVDAENRASTAESNLKNVNRDLAQARVKIDGAERNAEEARNRLASAQTELNNAKTATARAKAESKLAASQIVAAQTEARAAAERASAAEARARTAQSAADASRIVAATLRNSATTSSDRAAATQAEAEAKVAAAEAKARRLEAERARLAEQLGTLETERAQAKARLGQISSERTELDAQLRAARAKNDETQSRLLRLEQSFNEAQAKAKSADLARIESAQAASQLGQKIKALEAQIATAERANQSGEALRLIRDLNAAKGQVQSLRTELATNQQALVNAQGIATQTQVDLEALRRKVTRPTTPVKAPAAEPVVTNTVMPPPPPQVRTRITNVTFKDENTSTSVIVNYSGPLQYTLKKEGSQTRILEIKNAVIEAALERSLDTSEFGSAIQLVSSFQAPPPGDQVRIVVTLSGQVASKVIRNQQSLEWRFNRPQQQIPTVAALPPAPTWTPPPATEVKYEQPKAAVFTGLNQAISTRSIGKPRPVRRKRYTGRKINIDIKDGDIHNILRLLAKEGNVNIVTSDEVTGSITMHLKLVPWDQALEIILRTKGLDMVREGDIIRVAPSESIAKERESELKKQEVQEKLKPLEVKLITVNHASAGDLMPRVKSVLSKRGTSEFDERTNTVILKDVDDHLDAAADLISRLDTQTPQVLIETRIVEVNEVNTQQLGIQWGVDSTWSAATGNPTGLRFPSSIGIAGGADDQQGSTEGVSSNPNYVVNLPASAGLGSGGALGLTFGSIDSTFNLNVRLTALENRGSVKIVSSPKITTLDNKKAQISQGVSIPISQVSASGIQTVFFDAVLLLEATPHVTQDGNIYLKLRAQNNTPDFQNVGARGDPTILKKEALTELLLKDGDTTVIGGIYTSNAGYNRSEVPFLAKIPILGAMFRNHQESDRRSELLIFVTPRIVNRAASTVKTAQ